MKYVIASVFFASHLNIVLTVPMVKTLEGNVSGTKRVTRNGREIFAFCGIPYAKPPVGDLRFRDPLPKEPWNGILKADKDGKQCMQFLPDNNHPESEDCLFLNVFTPQLPVDGITTSLLPVMVYIHGGAFIEGSSNSQTYGPEFLLDKDIILVSMNYRLGIFGFLSTGDEAIPGNFGLKDQSAALKWVQRNIQAFGGNRNNVTLYGHSAGAGSVYFHVASNKSKHLFSRCIMHGAIFLSPQLYHTRPLYYTYPKKVAEMYNCPNETSSAIANCLRTLSASQLQNTTSVFSILHKKMFIQWGATVEPPYDEAFLPINLMEHPLPLVTDIPMIFGFALEDGLLLTRDFYTDEEFYKAYVKNVTLFLENIFLHIVANPSNDSKNIAMKVKNFYIGRELPSDKNEVIRGFSRIYTDVFEVQPFLELFKLNMRYKKKALYAFIWKYRGALSETLPIVDIDPVIPAGHADQLFYVFPIDGPLYGLPDKKRTKNDYKIVDLVIEFWTSFAITGVPTSPNVKWDPYPENLSYLLIGNYSDTTAAMSKNVCQDRVEFFTKNLSPYLKMNDIIQKDENPNGEVFDRKIEAFSIILSFCVLISLLLIYITNR